MSPLNSPTTYQSHRIMSFQTVAVLHKFCRAAAVQPGGGFQRSALRITVDIVTSHLVHVQRGELDGDQQCQSPRMGHRVLCQRENMKICHPEGTGADRKMKKKNWYILVYVKAQSYYLSCFKKYYYY